MLLSPIHDRASFYLILRPFDSDLFWTPISLDEMSTERSASDQHERLMFVRCPPKTRNEHVEGLVTISRVMRQLSEERPLRCDVEEVGIV